MVDENGNEKKINYSVIALESNEVYLNSPTAFDDVFDSEISVSKDVFEAFRISKRMEAIVAASKTWNTGLYEEVFSNHKGVSGE